MVACERRGQSSATKVKGESAHLGVGVDGLRPVALLVEDVVALVSFGEVAHCERHESEIPAIGVGQLGARTEVSRFVLTSNRCDQAAGVSSQNNSITEQHMPTHLDVLPLRCNGLMERLGRGFELSLGRVETASEVEEEDAVRIPVEVVLENVGSGGDVDSADSEEEGVSFTRAEASNGRRTGGSWR